MLPYDAFLEVAYFSQRATCCRVSFQKNCTSLNCDQQGVSEEIGTWRNYFRSGKGWGSKEIRMFESLLCRWAYPASPSSWRLLASSMWSSVLLLPAATGTSICWEGSHIRGLWGQRNISETWWFWGLVGWAGGFGAGMWEWKELRTSYRRQSPWAQGTCGGLSDGAWQSERPGWVAVTRVMQSDIRRNKNSLSYLFCCFYRYVKFPYALVWYFSTVIFLIQEMFLNTYYVLSIV